MTARILVGDDGGVPSRAALQVAVAAARGADGTLTLPDDLSVTSIVIHLAPGPALIKAAEGGTYDAIVIGSPNNPWHRLSGVLGHLHRHNQVPVVIVARPLATEPGPAQPGADATHH